MPSGVLQSSRLRMLRCDCTLGVHAHWGVEAMAVLSTDLLALRTRELADLIETLPVSLAPEIHHRRCCELIEQLAVALDLLVEPG